MKLRSILIWCVIVGMLALVVPNVRATTGLQETGSDDRNLWWDRFDVQIDNIDTTANRFEVTETYQLTIEQGPYRSGFVEIPLDRLQSIDNVQISHNGQALLPDCAEAPGTFCISSSADTVSITYYFVQPAQSGDQPTIELRYTVTGALRSYEEGDELFWAALPADLHGFDVLSSRVVVIMPEGLEILAATSYPDTWQQITEENTLTWVSPDLPSDDGMFEVRVQYPHNPAMPKPDWQYAYDRSLESQCNLPPILCLILAIVIGLFY